MVDMNVVKKFLFDKRFRMDVKSLKSSKPIFEFYAWELIESVGLDGLLREGSSLENMVKSKKIKNVKMLVNILDLLVGSGFLNYTNEKYKFIKKPQEPSGKNRKYLEKYYPYSTKWADALRSFSKKSLLEGAYYEESGFGNNSDTSLWNGMMKESPHSLRLYAIKTMIKNIGNNSNVLEIGCGTGVSLEQIIKNCDKKISITGLDYSSSMLDKAKKNIKVIKSENMDNDVVVNNIENLKLIKADAIKDNISGSYDAIFMSLILNHIDENRRVELYNKIKVLLKENGKLYIYQIVHQDKFKRSPIWMMHMVESHKEYPFRSQYIKELNSVFSKVDEQFMGNIIIANK